MSEPLRESALEAMYEQWVDSGAHADECNHYGHERAAFYAGVAAALGVRVRRSKVAREPRDTGAGWVSEGQQPVFFSERPDGKPWAGEW